MDGAATRKVTVKLTYNPPLTSSRPSSRTNSPRPPSPLKFTQPSASSVVSTTFRPKAKVNSSANTRKTPAVVSHASATPRAGSPTKLVRARNGTLSPTFQPKAITTKANVRPQTPNSAPGTPEIRPRTPAGSEVGKAAGTRARQGSVSQLHHTMSFSSLQSTNHSPTSSSPPLRIRSKVSGIIKTAHNEGSPPVPKPALPVLRPTQARLRSTSSSSNVSQVLANTSPPLYPITTATPAANPHRFGQMRPSPPTAYHPYQPLVQASADKPVNRPRFNVVAKVDISATSTPPPLSPPSSALSFSSRSSVSHSSASQTGGSSLSLVNLDNRRANGALEQFKPAIDEVRTYSANSSDIVDENEGMSNSGLDADDGERKVKAEAKSNRKIADLEITNRSLLSINASLETAKHRQAKEIRELRRKLRESRLILPPRAYLEVKSSQPPEEADDEEDDEEDSELEDAAEGNGDEIYQRVKMMIEGLLASGKRALERKFEDFPEGAKGGAKVLSAEEVQSWQRSTHKTTPEDETQCSETETENMSVSNADMSFSSTIDDDGFSENDDEISFDKDMFPRAIGPPIHIIEA